MQRSSRSSSPPAATPETAAIPRAGAFDAATRGAVGTLPFRTEMEHAFGEDLSTVRVHLGAAPALARLDALAAARGDTIAFASASPDRETVAHELAHVVQWRRAGSPSPDASIAPQDSAAEHEADAVAPRAAAGESVTIRTAIGSGVHLKGGFWKKLFHTAASEEAAEHGESAEMQAETGNTIGENLEDIAIRNETYGDDAKERAEDPRLSEEERKSAEREEQHAEAVGEDVTLASLAEGAMASEAAAVVAMFKMGHHAAALKNANTTEERIEHVSEGAASLGKAGLQSGQAAAATGRFASIASGASNVGDWFATVGAGMGGLLGIVSTVQNASKSVMSIAKAIKTGGSNWSELSQNSLATLRSVIQTGGALVNTVNWIMTAANITTGLAGVIPLLGPAINIVVKLITILMQIIAGAAEIINLIDEKKARKELEKQRDRVLTGDPKELQVIDRALDINQKQINRRWTDLFSKNIIPSMLDIGSIGGSIMEVVGVATSPAYGAGVAVMAAGAAVRGMSEVLKLLSVLSPMAYRTVKQQLRNLNDNKHAHKLLKYMHLSKRTTKVKNQEYKEDAEHINAMIEDLPGFDPAMSVKAQAHDTRKAYHERGTLKALRKGLGVEKEALLLAADSEARVEVLIEAMKKR
ncbi:MAG TPA: DUF4157 domain-containing protein [Kofleriaceae bacterium]